MKQLYSQLDTSNFEDNVTHCVAIHELDDNNDYIIVAITEDFFEAEKLAKQLEKEDKYLYTSVGTWFKRAFWFDDENHTATFEVPIDVAKKYLDEEEFNDELAYAQDMKDYIDEGNLSLTLGQMWTTPQGFTDDGFEEDEILEYYGYSTKMLEEGGYFTGWCDG